MVHVAYISMYYPQNVSIVVSGDMLYVSHALASAASGAPKTVMVMPHNT